MPPPPDVPVAVLLAIVELRTVTVPAVMFQPPPSGEELLEMVLPGVPAGAVMLTVLDVFRPPPLVTAVLPSIVHPFRLMVEDELIPPPLVAEVLLAMVDVLMVAVPPDCCTPPPV